MKFTTRVTDMLQITYPIIQAGMAGTITTPELVAAVSNAGGLGTLGAGYMKPEKIREAVREIRKLTVRPFAVNLLITRRVQAKKEEMEKAQKLLNPIGDRFGVPLSQNNTADEDYKEKLAVLIEERVPVFSFAFDVPELAELQELRRNGTKIIGTATNVREARALVNMGADIIVGQGSEAGGHRGTFLGTAQSSMIGTMALIPQLADALPHIPIIAAGGIMDGRGLAASLALGADAVQMGTAFLTCTESKTHPVHQKAVLESNDQSTSLTRAFSGRYARGIENTFMVQLRDKERTLPPYPILNGMTAGIRKAAAAKNDKEYMSLWAGQASSMARRESAGDLVKRVASEAYERLYITY
jgi:nitronate monooxygenase